MSNYLVPEGFKDDVSDKAFVEHHYKNIIVNLFRSYGYELVKSPLIEYKNHKSSSNSFDIEVKKNLKKLVVRDDITMQVARLSSSRLFKKNRPLKLCYYGEVVRKKGSMLRPERQFLQIGAECIGEKSIQADAEIMELAFSALKLVGIKDITIEVSSKIFLENFYSSLKNLKNINEIKRLIKLKDLEGAKKFLTSKEKKYLTDIFSCTGDYFKKKNNLEKLKTNKLYSNEVNNIHKLINIVCKNNKKIQFFVDLCELKNKKYYKGI